jgi:branched-chain amino acid transport system ATP-binding protein
MLKIRGLRAGYHRSTVLTDINLDVGQGQIVALLGTNGSGKTTLAHSIIGTLPLQGGCIAFEGTEIQRLQSADRVRRGLVLIPENRHIFTGMTVEENLNLGAYLQSRTLTRAQLRQRIKEVCSIFPVLSERLHEPGVNLSGGQQQMLAIARGLMSKPRLLILDEPSLGLAPLLVAEVLALVRSLRDRGLSILISEQNARQVLAIADYGFVLENGRIAAEGPASQLAESPEIAERYLNIGASFSTVSDQAAARYERLHRVLSL